MDNEFISVKEGGLEKIVFGNVDGIFDFKLLNDDLGEILSQKSGIPLTSRFKLVRNGGSPFTVITHPETIEFPVADLSFRLDEDSFVFYSYSVNARSNSATVEGRITVRLDGKQFTVDNDGSLQSSASYVIFGTSSGTGRLVMSNPQIFLLPKGAHLFRIAVQTSGAALDTITIDSISQQLLIFGK